MIDKIAASSERGVLKITLPGAEEAKRRNKNHCQLTDYGHPG